MRAVGRATGVATAVGALLVSMASPATGGPEAEVAWEAGSAAKVYDGDTLDVAISQSSSGITGTQRVRTIGIQAPEVKHSGQQAQCGSAEAEARLEQLLTRGTPVQLRSLDPTSFDTHSGGRIIRSIYALDEEGNWFDTSRQLVTDGTVMWFPRSVTSATKAEFAHNLEYRVLADDAASARRGLWTPDMCGPAPHPGANLRLSISWDQTSRLDGHETIFVFNEGGASVGLGGWLLRDTALNKYRFPGGAVVPAGGSVEVRLTSLPAGAVNGADGVYYLGYEDNWFGNLPADNPDFVGDAVLLMDSAGPLETGNLRTWFAYPCNPDACVDPLKAKVRIDGVDWSEGVDLPSAPRQVDVTSASDGSGDITVTWLPPTYVGDAVGIDRYRVTATQVGGSSLDPMRVTTTSATLEGTDLVVGAAYTVTVEARNAQGWSPPSAPSAPVTSRTAPSAPRTVLASPMDAAATVRWQPPTTDNGSAVTSYEVQATTKKGPAGSCATADAALSCVVTGLENGTTHTFTVTASNAAGRSAPSDTSNEVTPEDPTGTTGAAGAIPSGDSGDPTAPVPAVTPPTDVAALPLPGAAVVSWAPVESEDGSPATQYTALASPAGSGGPAVSSCAADGGATSCILPTLANGTSYDVTVQVTAPVPGPVSTSVQVTPVADERAHAATGTPTPAPVPWKPRETITLVNRTNETLGLGGYGLWDKNPRKTTDTPDYLFPRDARIAPGGTLRVRSGAPTAVDPASASLLYRGADRTRSLFSSSGDRVELSNLNTAPVTCIDWGSADGTCRGERPKSSPTPPLGITARATPSSVVINWGAPISTGGSPITSWTATAYDVPNGGSPVGSCTAAAGARSCSIPATIGRRYFAEVTAANAIGVSGPSAPRVLATPRTVPTAPGSVTATGTTGGITVSWTASQPNGAAVSAYTASAYTSGTGGAPAGSCVASGGAMACTITGLSFGTPYYVDVTATNRAGTGPASSPRVAATPSGQPSARSTYKKRRVTVRWDPPVADSHVVTGYVAKVYSKASGGKLLGSCTAGPEKTKCRTKKMKSRKRYYISLRTLTAAGSFTVTPRIVTGPKRKPSRVKSVSAAAEGRRVVISWAPPTWDGFTSLKKYSARLYSKKRGGKVKARCTATASELTCTTKELRPRTYYASVRVKNGKGWSKWTTKKRRPTRRHPSEGRPRSDDGWATGPRHGPHGGPVHGVPLPRIHPPALAEALPPGVPRLWVAHPQRGDQGPRARVHGSQRPRQVASGQQDPVARVQVPELRVTPRIDHGVVDRDVAGVPGDVAGIPHPPAQLDALVGIEEQAGPPARGVEHRPADGDRTLPEAGRRTGSGRVPGAQPGHPARGGRATGRILHPGLDQPDLRALGEDRGEAGQGVRAGQRRVVVEEEQQVAGHLGDAGVPPGRDADVVGQRVPADPVGQPGRGPSVAHHDDVRTDAPLVQDRLEPAPQVVGSLAHGQHDHAEPGLRRAGHAGLRSLADERIARTWPATVGTASTSMATTRIRVTTTSEAMASPIAARNARIVISTEW